ncbi:leucine/isoleucine/valine transporter permease subunit [Caballeronia arationis]|uniref:Amino acid/amide ABC transporter membrane protein 2, HAAT family n=1 Tax=Caballeronia arationis TaxID=1777142 RepID=A0A7Z7IFJ8_9BURK|nr:branched-chain amino acid ABC transporter permease [Caballeronia arationis]SAK65810.1 leucine/isoleucine/valine transporter permease subunit [Caballeronia arationis]SOE89153.1 amino acid/amide ABC transporter membrane protein 2, HAAT family [Caballeronia arationis]
MRQASTQSSAWHVRAPFVLFLAVAVAAPLFLTTGFQLRLLSLICIYAILSMGFNLLYGYAGQIAMGHQGFFAIAAYAYALLQLKAGLSPLAALPASLVICAIVALVIGVPLLRLRTHYLAMATLCFGLVISGVANRWIDVTGGTGGLLIPSITIGEKTMDRMTLYYVIVAATALVLALQNFIVSSHLGRSLQAIRDDDKAAAALGVNVAAQKLRVFVLSAVLAGVAGVGFAVVSRQVSPSMGEFPILVSMLTIAVVGGLATRYGPILGSIVVVLAPQFLTRFGELETLVYGLCLLLFLIFMPHGLSGMFSSLVSKQSVRFVRRSPPRLPPRHAVKKGVGR